MLKEELTLIAHFFKLKISSCARSYSSVCAEATKLECLIFKAHSSQRGVFISKISLSRNEFQTYGGRSVAVLRQIFGGSPIFRPPMKATSPLLP